MDWIIERIRAEASAHHYWLKTQHGASDVLDILKQVLAPDWTVDRTTDCDGGESIIILPSSLESTVSFILYEEAGSIIVATIIDDEWAGISSFASFRAAVTALMIMTRYSNRMRDADEPPEQDIREVPAAPEIRIEPEAIAIEHVAGRFFIAPLA